MDELYQLTDNHPWGDFGMILISGFLWDVNVPDRYEVIRTGPFIPPVTFPSGFCVIVDAVKTELEQGLFFIPCIYSPYLTKKDGIRKKNIQLLKELLKEAFIYQAVLV